MTGFQFKGYILLSLVGFVLVVTPWIYLVRLPRKCPSCKKPALVEHFRKPDRQYHYFQS
jgi:hypothetical protein